MSNGLLSNCGQSLVNTPASQNGSHFWLPDGILQEVDKNAEHLEKDQGEASYQTCNPFKEQEYGMLFTGWHVGQTVVSKDAQTSNKKLGCKSTNWYRRPKNCSSSGHDRDDSSLCTSSRIKLLFSRQYRDLNCELRLWLEHQARNEAGYKSLNIEDDNFMLRRKWNAQSKRRKSNGNIFKLPKLNFEAKAVERKKSLQQKDCLSCSNPSFQRKKPKKLPFCRHYNDGYCKRGSNCEFQHILNGAYPDAQKVFLGGLPLNITERELSQRLKAQGYNVINEPSIMHKYAPQVCLETAEEAQRLINRGTIIIDGAAVDVRRYEAVTKKQQERLADITRRSVFLGGLEKETTPKIIRYELAMIGMKVVNHLTIKSGFCPQVTLATSEQACNLISKVKVQIKGKWVNVRPYVPKLVH